MHSGSWSADRLPECFSLLTVEVTCEFKLLTLFFQIVDKLYCLDNQNVYSGIGGFQLNPDLSEETAEEEWKYFNEVEGMGQDEEPESQELGPATYICYHCNGHKDQHVLKGGKSPSDECHAESRADLALFRPLAAGHQGARLG